MTAPIDLATDADIAEALRLAADGAIMGARAAVLLPKMATHLAALREIGAAIVQAHDNAESHLPIDTLRALCGDGPADLVLVPAAELARLRAVEAQSRAPIHYAAVGHLCVSWERGARATSDHAFVTCADCREHFIPDDPEQGIRSTRFGEECPACTVKLPPCEEGNTVKCPECNTEFLRADGPRALFPMEPEEGVADAEYSDAEMMRGRDKYKSGASRRAEAASLAVIQATLDVAAPDRTNNEGAEQYRRAEAQARLDRLTAEQAARNGAVVEGPWSGKRERSPHEEPRTGYEGGPTDAPASAEQEAAWRMTTGGPVNAVKP